MTKQEAIRILIDLQDGSGQVYEAIRMAIEALSEPSKVDYRTDESANIGTKVNDLISRADAIDALYRSSVYSWSVEQDQSAHTWALNIIAELPSADRHTGDLISREDAKKEVYVLGKNPPINDIWECLDALPSADRPQGEWVVVDDDLKCSVCGKSAPISHVICGGDIGLQDYYNFCPNCGARMEATK